MNRALRVFDWIKIGAVVALLIFLIGHNFPIHINQRDSPPVTPPGFPAGIFVNRLRLPFEQSRIS